VDTPTYKNIQAGKYTVMKEVQKKDRINLKSFDYELFASG